MVAPGQMQPIIKHLLISSLLIRDVSEIGSTDPRLHWRQPVVIVNERLLNKAGPGSRNRPPNPAGLWEGSDSPGDLWLPFWFARLTQAARPPYPCESVWLLSRTDRQRCGFSYWRLPWCDRKVI